MIRWQKLFLVIAVLLVTDTLYARDPKFFECAAVLDRGSDTRYQKKPTAADSGGELYQKFPLNRAPMSKSLIGKGKFTFEVPDSTNEQLDNKQSEYAYEVLLEAKVVAGASHWSLNGDVLEITAVLKKPGKILAANTDMSDRVHTKGLLMAVEKNEVLETKVSVYNPEFFEIIDNTDNFQVRNIQNNYGTEQINNNPQLISTLNAAVTAGIVSPNLAHRVDVICRVEM